MISILSTFLLSAAGKMAIVGLHVKTICEYLKRYL